FHPNVFEAHQLRSLRELGRQRGRGRQEIARDLLRQDQGRAAIHDQLVESRHQPGPAHAIAGPHGVNAHRTYRIIYHIGDTLDLRTKGLEGRATLTQGALTITGPSPIDVPIRELRGAELFRLHGLGRVIRISHERGTAYVSVVRFVLFGGYFASINFFRTGELARRLREAIEVGAPSR